ncbi:hypothetical protein VTK26DRAFT_5245 [Humicola hyalothermophila]
MLATTRKRRSGGHSSGKGERGFPWSTWGLLLSFIGISSSSTLLRRLDLLPISNGAQRHRSLYPGHDTSTRAKARLGSANAAAETAHGGVIYLVSVRRVLAGWSFPSSLSFSLGACVGSYQGVFGGAVERFAELNGLFAWFSRGEEGLFLELISQRQ